MFWETVPPRAEKASLGGTRFLAFLETVLPGAGKASLGGTRFLAFLETVPPGTGKASLGGTRPPARTINFQSKQVQNPFTKTLSP